MPFLDKNVVDQIRIFGTNKDEWKAALLEEIDADQLPVYYGGTLSDPDGDGRCLSKVKLNINCRPIHFILLL